MCSTGTVAPRDPDPDGIHRLEYDAPMDQYHIQWKSGFTETITSMGITMDKAKAQAMARFKDLQKERARVESMYAAYQAQAGTHTHNVSNGLTGLGSSILGGTGLANTTAVNTYNPYTTYTVPSGSTVTIGSGGTGTALGYTIPSTAVYSTDPNTLQLATVAKPRQKLTGGDLIVCKNDHPICIVMEDFEVGSEGDWRSKMGFWQQDKTPTDLSPQDYDCEICKASFTRSAPEYLPGHAFIVRHAPKEETSDTE